MAGQTTGRIASCEIRIRASGPVEAAAGAYVKDPAAHGKEDGPVVLAVEGEQRARRVRAEHFGRRAARERRNCVGARNCGVGRVQEHAEQDEVECSKGRRRAGRETENGGTQMLARWWSDV